MKEMMSPMEQNIERESVISIIKERGKDDPLAMEIRGKWLDQEQKRYENADFEGRLQYDINHALLLGESGCTDTARNMLEGTLEVAETFSLEEVAASIREHINQYL